MRNTDTKTAARLIEENMHKIYAWVYAKLYNKNEAEDLAQDIIYALLRSAPHIEKEEAFFGFMWRTAENILGTYIRRKNRRDSESYEEYMGVYPITPEDSVIRSEELSALRRELALLSEQYRESAVKYYIYGKSCSEISAELGISTEMVKYYLFKVRRILKEGIDMKREFGERSYDPLTFRINYWGGGSNSIYLDIFKRRLPGNIMLLAYDAPIGITELSAELGVAAPYLEDELKILEEHELIRKIGKKYQTNIIIFTNEFEKKVSEKIRPIHRSTAEEANALLNERMDELAGLDFYGSDLDRNRLKTVFANIALYLAVRRSDKACIERYGDYPPISNGSFGFIFGHDNDYENSSVNGIYGYYENPDKTAWLSAENYCALKSCQDFQPKSDKSFLALLDAAFFKNADKANEETVRFIEEGLIFSDNGKLSPNFTVFGQKTFDRIGEILEPVTDAVSKCMLRVCEIAGDTLRDHAPKALADKCGQLAHIYFQIDSMGNIMGCMTEMGMITVPDKKTNPCIFAVTSE